jgi:hypothetical protein
MIQISLNKFQAKKTDGKILMEPSKTLGRFRMEGPVYGNKESDGDISSQYSRFQGVGTFQLFSLSSI